MSERPLHEGKLDRAQTLSNVRSKATYEAISVNPVTPVIGVEVEGVDMTSDVPDAQIEELSQALANHNVLFFAAWYLYFNSFNKSAFSFCKSSCSKISIFFLRKLHRVPHTF